MELEKLVLVLIFGVPIYMFGRKIEHIHDELIQLRIDLDKRLNLSGNLESDDE